MKHKINQPSLQTLPHPGHYEVPIGCRWGQNICTYDCLFTPLFALWCNNRECWVQNIKGMGNVELTYCLTGFPSMRGVRFFFPLRTVRQLIACSQNGATFGCYTSIEEVCAHIVS